MDTEVTILKSVIELGPVFAVLVIVIFGLAWAWRDQRSENKAITQDYLDSMEAHSDKFSEVVTKNTQAFTQLSEVIRATISKNL